MSIRNEIEYLLKHAETQEEKDRLIEMLQNYNGADKVVTSEEIKQSLIDKPLPLPIPTCAAGIDSIIKGFHNGQLIVLTGNPASGKTSYALHLIEKMQEHKPAAIFLEQPPRELIATLIERDLSVPYFITPKTNRRAKMSWIRARALESKSKYGCKILFIDHFQYFQYDGEEKLFSEKEKIDRMLEELKELAGFMDIPIVVLAHVRKMNDPTDIPTEYDLQGSAGFNQLADTIIILWRENYREGKEVKTSNKTLCSIRKNRRYGPTGSFKMKYENYKFIEDDNIEFEHEKFGDGY
jgi:replicative DNA helicase